MGLISTEVEVGLDSKTIKWYEEKGYEIPRWIDNRGRLKVKRGTKIIVNVKDLPDGSGITVDIKCDECGTEMLGIRWVDYKDRMHEDGKNYCKKCSNNLFGSEKRNKIYLERGISFYDWCYKYLSKEVADLIMLRWDYELNIKNGKVISPKDVSHGSDGFDKRGYWFKCLDHPEHGSELKNICRFTYYYKGFMGSIECIKCNVISISHPHLVQYFINKEDTLKYSYGSNESILMRCPHCGFEREKRITDLVSKGFSCKICSDQIPYSEKFLANLLRQILNQEFITQLSKTTFKWCGKYKYDFYIDKINGICETMGSQHYKQSSGNWGLLEKVQENDKQKELLAKNNRIDNYIIIDCRKSKLEWIKNSIMQSDLPELLNFKEDDIDWLKCHEYACNSNLVKEVCNLWNSGIKSTIEIAEQIKIGKSTAWKYLNIGTELGWCDAIKRHKTVQR